MKDDLKKQIAEFVFQSRRIASSDRVSDLIGFLNRVRRNRGKILPAIPWAAMLRVAQPRHDREEAVEGTRHHERVVTGMASRNTKREHPLRTMCPPFRDVTVCAI